MRKRTDNANQIAFIIQEMLNQGIMNMQVIYNYQTRDWLIIGE